MKNLISIIVILLISSFTTKTQTDGNFKDYNAGINYSFNKLNEIRSNVRFYEKSIQEYATKNISKNRKCDLSKWSDSLFPFILNKKLCDEALKRCKLNIKINGIKNLKHRYPFKDCKESLAGWHTNFSSNQSDEEIVYEMIRNLILDNEPTLTGHREMLLETDQNYKYVGFGYVIERHEDKVDAIIIVLTASFDGLRNPINFQENFYYKEF